MRASRTLPRGDRSRGLTAAEAAARLARDGPNRLPAAKPPSPWRELLGQLTHFFAVMLWAAAALALLAGMAQLAVAIAVVVLVNGAFAFAQEYRADRAAERLRDLLPTRIHVRRDGRVLDIDAAEVVVGDTLVLAGGDRIPADATVAEAHSLMVDTSTLTGESVPESFAVGGALFASTFVVSGEGEAVVTATGGHTRLAAIAELTRGRLAPTTPLALELRRVVRVVTVVALGVGGAFMLLALLLGMALRDGFVFAIGVTVALVPEGLLPTVTLSLARGAQRMADRNALVRRLESVETLGSTTFICTDKTGTLTRNQMAVVETWRAEGVDEQALAAAAEAASGTGDPMEAAIVAFARGLDLAAPGPSTRRFPFDADRRRMSVVVGDWLLVKGAPDAVAPLCDNAESVDGQVAAMAERGLRVLAVARRPVAEVGPHDDAGRAEQCLHLLGLLGLEDPPRPEARHSLAAVRRAGVKVAMVTGDHPATALAIAREVGLYKAGAPTLQGRDLPDDDQVLGALIDRDGAVLSRVSPEQKLRIAQALRGRGHVLAMTGDGVNDGPALREADIGVAMGQGGTDVAREAADVVLLDDDFATVVAAVEQGRATFANIRRFLTYHLTDNVAELTPFVVWALSGGRFPLALGVLQILALDIGTDLLPALALGAEPPSPHALTRAPYRGHLIDGPLLFRVFAVLGPAEAVVELAAFVAAFLAAGWSVGSTFPGGHVLEAASGAAFAAVVLGQLGNAFACRSTSRSAFRLRAKGNRLLLGAVAVEVAALVAFLFVGPAARVLGQAPPPWAGAVVALAAPAAVLAVDSLHKHLHKRLRSRGRSSPVARDNGRGRISRRG